MTSTAKVKERVLDSNLLAGSLNVDDYATALLAEHSLEHATRELERLEKEVLALRSENTQLHARLEGSDAKPAPVGAVVEHPERKRKFPAVAALFEARASAQRSLEPLKRIQSHVTWTPAGGTGDTSSPVSLWYSDVFSDELKVLETVNQKLVEASTNGPTPRETELQSELQAVKKDLGVKAQLLQAITAERDELLDWRDHAETEMEAVTTERDQLNDVREAIEAELAKANAVREELERSLEEYDLKSRSFQELNKALTSKLTVIETLHKQETMRSLRAYEYIFRLQQNAQKRHILQKWRSAAEDARKSVRADTFRSRMLLQKTFVAWRNVISENRLVRGAQIKLEDRKLAFIIRIWGRFCVESAKKRRAATLFARLKETQRVRLCFREWRSQARLMKLESSENETNVDLPSLRAAAAKAKVPAIIYAASRGMTEAVLSVINEGGAVDMKERGTGKTPLHAAAEAGSVAVVEVLLENGAVATATDAMGETALQRVVQKGPDASVEVALALLRNGADPKCVAAKDGRSLLHMAVDSRVPPQLLTELLKYKAPVSYQQPSSGKTALHAAASKGDYASLEIILQSLINNVSESWKPDAFPVDIHRQTVLHAACGSNAVTPQCLRALLDANFNPEALNEAGETPLHVLCKNPSASPVAARVILKQVVDLNKQDNQKNTALHYACQLNLREVALELVQHGAPLYVINDDTKCPLDLPAPAFAIELLRAMRVPPISSRYKAALAGLNTCMKCHSSLTDGYFGRRVGDHCSRCGRLFCSKCLTKEAEVVWPNSGETTTITSGGGGILATSLETTSKMINMLRRPSKVCDHCFNICEEMKEEAS